MKANVYLVEGKLYLLRNSSSGRSNKNPFVYLTDDPDYLSETFIEEKEMERKKQENAQRPETEQAAEYNQNYLRNEQPVEVDDQVFHQDDVQVQQADNADPEQPNLGNDNRPETRANPNPPQEAAPESAAGANANQSSGRQRPANDDDLFNSAIYREGIQAAAQGEPQDYDLDFESSRDNDSSARNPRNFNTNNGDLPQQVN